jgi:DNA (cytosine-5)-methyltransferase 1
MRAHLDLFSGIGGFALAANWAGYTTIGFCEIDDYCVRVLRHHFPDVPVWGDVRTLTGAHVLSNAHAIGRDTGREGVPQGHQHVRGGQSLSPAFPSGSARVVPHANGHGEPTESEHGGAGCGELGLITAGYPCQPFSLAGKRLGAEDDRHLWPEVKRLLAELRPARFLGENVAGHINMGLDDVLSDLEDIGYTSRAVVVPACAVNAPHRRDRVWIMAHARRAERGQGDTEGRSTPRQHDLHGGWPQGAGGTSQRGEAPADTASARRNDSGQHDGGPSPLPTRLSECGDLGAAASRHEAQQRVGIQTHGLPGRLVDARWGGDPLNAFGPNWEDGVPRVVATERDRVHRLKALGNAIVPQVAFQVLMAMEAA